MNAGLILLILTVASLVFAFVDVDIGSNIDWGYLGLGAVAGLAFLALAKPGIVQRAMRKVGIK